MRWPFDNTFARELPQFYAECAPVPVAAPRLLALNEELAREIGLDPNDLRSPDGLAILSGNAVPDGARPLAQAYAGHQFGQLSPMLGDGRAHLLGELLDSGGRRRDVAYKGSGRTVFSRGGDGRAVVGPVLREFVVGEAMHAFGIPTTRALAAVGTGEAVFRQGPMPGAILTRVAASHLRVGTFEIFRTRGTVEQLRELLAYAVRRHYPDLDPGDALGFLAAVQDRQAELVAAWMSVGFIHGVMNTDNTTISGETIDYGPCAFLDAYDPDAVFSSIDQGGRYRYRNQPPIMQWNLTRLAECLIGLIPGETEDGIAAATAVLEHFPRAYAEAHLRRFRNKLALPQDGSAEDDEMLIDELLEIMAVEQLDFTRTFRELATSLRAATDPVEARVHDADRYAAWRARWLNRLGDHQEATASMEAVNPAYIPRNHLVEEALDAAQRGDLAPFETLLDAVREPFTERSGLDRYADPAPPEFTRSYVTYCGT